MGIMERGYVKIDISSFFVLYSLQLNLPYAGVLNSIFS